MFLKIHCPRWRGRVSPQPVSYHNEINNTILRPSQSAMRLVTTARQFMWPRRHPKLASRHDEVMYLTKTKFHPQQVEMLRSFIWTRWNLNLGSRHSEIIYLTMVDKLHVGIRHGEIIYLHAIHMMSSSWQDGFIFQAVAMVGYLKQVYGLPIGQYIVRFRAHPWAGGRQKWCAANGLH